jgi:putative glutamine amidotransferase
MRFIGVTQRVEVVPVGGGGTERRDCLDQAWAPLLHAADCLPIPLPNDPTVAASMFWELPMDGLLLTGGNHLAPYGGDAPERDETELRLLESALACPEPLPILGVCRGMQLLQSAFGLALERVDGHVESEQTITIEGRRETVNSFHYWGTRATVPPLDVWATADDGVVKAIRHRDRPIVGIMWHPERLVPIAERDLALLRTHFAERGSRG